MSVSHPVAWSQDHVDALAGARLPMSRGGYRVEDVDRWLQHVSALMRARQPVEPPTAGTFRRQFVGHGYDVHHVDALAAAVAGWQVDVMAASQERTVPVEPEPVRPTRPDTNFNWTVRQREWVRETAFPLRRGKWAYTMEEVDNFLDEVLTAMTKSEPLPSIESAKFLVCAPMRTGYDARAVDEFLDQVVRLRPAL